MPSEVVATSERVFLFFCYGWSAASEGIAMVNRSLALSLAGFDNVKLYCTVLRSEAETSPIQKEDAKRHGITLIYANELASLSAKLPNVTHLVGHAPIMVDSLLEIKEQFYPRSRLILFYHVLPSDVDRFAHELPYPVPTDNELIAQAEKADLVYSVSDPVYYYYSARFRNRASVQINHKIYHPQCPLDFFSLDRRPVPASGPFKVLTLTTGEGTGSWIGVDIAACAAAKVAEAAVSMQEQGRSCRKSELTIGGMVADRVAATRDGIASVPGCAKPEGAPEFAYDFRPYKSPSDLLTDLSQHALCVIPSRAEPFGCGGLQPLSAGIPTLIAENSFLAPLIRKLSLEPDYFLG